MRSDHLRVLAVLFTLWLVLIGGNWVLYAGSLLVRILHHGLLSVVLVWWVWRYGLLRIPLFWALAGAVFVVMVSALQSPHDSRMALENGWFWANHALLLLIFVDWVRRGYGGALLHGHYIAGALLAVVGFWQYLNLPGERVAGGFFLVNLLGMYVAPVLVMVVGELRAGWRWRYVLLALALGALLLLNGSRGAFLSADVGCLVLLLMHYKPSRRQLVIAAIPAVVGLFLIVNTSLRPDRQYGDAYRADLWRAALAMQADYPLTGVGLGLYGAEYIDRYGERADQVAALGAHNVLLNLAAELGVIGLLAGAVVFVAWVCHIPAARDARQNAALAALVGIGVHLLFDFQPMTSFVSLVLLLAAFLVPVAAPVVIRPALRGFVACGLLVFCAWLLRGDYAQLYYERSLRGGVTDAITARQLDPALDLYAEQVDYLLIDRASGRSALTPEAVLIAYARFWR